MKKFFTVLTAAFFAAITLWAQNLPNDPLPDVSKWKLPEDVQSLFSDHFVSGDEAVTYLMQRYSWKANPTGDPEKYSMIEKLLSNDPKLIKQANTQIKDECRRTKENFESWKKLDDQRMELLVMTLMALRVPDRLEPETHEAIRDILKFVDLTSKGAQILRWLYRDINNITWVGAPGGNGSNAHGSLCLLTLAPALITDNKAMAEGHRGLLLELNHFNTSGDMAEFNCMEAHWSGATSWEMFKKYIPDPYYRRVASIVAERIWINRFLTWSPAVERITGPGSRVAPGEIFGSHGLRPLVALGMKKPIWMNSFFQWENWDPKLMGEVWEQRPSEIMVPDLPDYLQDLAWNKK